MDSPLPEKTVILVIDDDAAILSGIRNFLEDLDYLVLSASDGLKGLEMFDRQQPDLLLVDLRMPGMDGLSVLNEVKTRCADIPLIVISGTGRLSDVVEAIHQGAWDYIFKPIEDLGILQYAIDRALERARLIRENRAYQESLEQQVKQRTSELEERMRELRFGQFALDHASDAMCWVTPDGHFSYVNEEACRSLGYCREELLTMTVSDVDPLLPRDKWASIWQEIRRATNFVWESQHKTKSGHLFPVEIRTNYIRFDGREYSFAIVRDISERKRAQSALLREREVQAALAGLGKEFLTSKKMDIEGLAQMVLKTSLSLTHSPHGFVNEVDPLTGWATNRAFTRDIFPLCQTMKKPLIFKERRGMWGWVLDHQQPLLTNAPGDHPCFTGTPDGHLPINRYLSVPVIRGEIVVGQVSVANGIRDYTLDDMKVLEMVANLYAIALERINLERMLRHGGKLKAIGILSAGIAHDFNNILAIILGNVEIALCQVSEGEGIHGDLQEIYKAGERAKSLVDQLLMFSRAGDSTRQILPLIPLVKEVNKFMRTSLPPTIEIETHYEANDLVVMGNADQLHQVFMNLCTNARQAISADRGKITITLKRVVMTEKDAVVNQLAAGEYALLQVQDTGVGISAKAMEHLFDPFFTTKEVGKGTGLGLAVAHGIVTNHGGTILVESTLGVGSVFRVYLPLLAEGLMNEREEAGLVSPPRGHGTVLVVDDEPQILSIYHKILLNLGYEVVAIQESPEALRLFAESPDHFAALITDQAMPQMTGEELACQVKAIRPDLPVILCTGLGGSALQDTVANQVLSKPVSLNHLAKAINELLKNNK